ncbi:uncharacterized protein LOC132723420 isoform X2 [Ruditapes philippinarum]|nr:uncharacterized protein LOC132723420 isoform X2 [Ruditapes philippinarum]
MNDQQLKNYIVAYGDRVATVAFCKGLKNTDHRTEKTLDRIRQKNLLSKKCSKLQGNKHAKKTQRRVELGLKQYDFFTKTYKQVRSQCGGGIRHLSVTVDSKLLEILQYGKDLFFPDGHNCFGSLDEFEVSLYDFQGHPAKLDQTLAECYDEFKLKLLRVYVYTKKKCPVTDGESTCTVEQTPQDDCPSVDSLEKQVTPEHTHVPPQESLSLGEASPGSCCVKKAEEHMVEAGTPTVLIKQSVLQVIIRGVCYYIYSR